MIFYLGLLFVNNIGRSLEEIRFGVLLIANADIHMSLILNKFFFKNIVEIVPMIILLQKLVLDYSDLRLLGVAIDSPLLTSFRLLSIMDDTRCSRSEVTRESLIS